MPGIKPMHRVNGGRYWVKLGGLALVILSFLVLISPTFISRSIWPDEALFCWSATRIAQGPGELFKAPCMERHPPLMPLFLAIASGHASSIEAFRSAAIMMSVACIVGIFFLGLEVGKSYCVGLMATVLLIFNPTFIFYASRVLADEAQMFFLILLVLMMFHSKGKEGMTSYWIGGLFLAALISLKWSGWIGFLIAALFYILFPPVRRRQGLVFFLTGGIMAGMLLILQWIHQGSILPNMAAVRGEIQVFPFWFYIHSFERIIPLPFALVWVCWGFIVWWRKDPRGALFWIEAFFLVLILLSLMGTKDMRFSFLLVPFSILPIVMGLEEIINRTKFSRWAMYSLKIAAVVLLVVFSAPKGLAMLPMAIRSHQMYTGFQGAGRVVGRLMVGGKVKVILAGSPWQLRFCSGYELEKYGGLIRYLPRSLEDLRGVLKSTHGSIVLVIDRWEFIQPSWAHPLDSSKAEILQQLNFNLKATISQPSPTGHRLPVAWIWERE